MTISIGAILPVGTIIHSMLSVAQFESQYGNNWVIADGRSVIGSLYASVTGISSIPDMRGGFLRAKGATLNPDGDLALGTLTADKFESHNHPGAMYISGSSNVTGYSSPGPYFNIVNGDPSGTGYVAPQGGNETAPVSITVNVFIRIN